MIYNIIPKFSRLATFLWCNQSQATLARNTTLAVANLFAPIVKIKGKSWICDDLLLVLCSTVRSAVMRPYTMNY
ncbi:hypothetical protein VC35_16575 [Pseudomonas fluorescens]|uniref:Uncharacterized protein n=1 Tax=Pseudomonas fluorescens TaxID=294 RepID=A0A0F4TN74_PSEFL|nr:hypothetical protein VC35_16575 [Pseudomonas fluorescens]